MFEQGQLSLSHATSRLCSGFKIIIDAALLQHLDRVARFLVRFLNSCGERIFFQLLRVAVLDDVSRVLDDVWEHLQRQPQHVSATQSVSSEIMSSTTPTNLWPKRIPQSDARDGLMSATKHSRLKDSEPVQTTLDCAYQCSDNDEKQI